MKRIRIIAVAVAIAACGELEYPAYACGDVGVENVVASIATSTMPWFNLAMTILGV